MSSPSLSLSLPVRGGLKPETIQSMPHSQLSENSDDEIYAALAEWLFSLENISEGPSAVSLPSSRAAWIADSAGPVRKGLTREFTHIHTEPGLGSQHLSLNKDDAAEVIEKGWGEAHPINYIIPDFELLMIFAPRDAEELEVIKHITLRAYDFVMGAD